MTDSSAVDGADRKELALPTDFKAIMLAGIFGLLLFYALYLTGEIVVPVLIAFFLKMVLQPAMEMLANFHVPRWFGALLIVCSLLGGVGGLGFILSGPAASWVAKPTNYRHD